MTHNPIITREWRVHWRQGYWLPLAYALVLAVVGYGLYQEFTVLADVSESRLLEDSPGAGRETLAILTGLQILLWSILAPALAAPSIAGDRERGVLEALQLSRLTPVQIVVGKLGGVLLFYLVLLLISLPFNALCFLLRDISGLDYLMSIVFQLAAVITCTSISLWCSAWGRRANIALRSSAGLILVWSIASFYCFANARWPGALPFFTPLSGNSNPLFEIIGDSNPVVMLIDFYLPAEFGRTATGSLFSWPIWLIGLLTQVALSITLLASSIRAVSRPLGETYWMERRNRKTNRRNNGRAPGAPLDEPETASARLGWWEIPVARRLPFDNPVLQREARGKFRMRQVPKAVIIAEALLGLAVLYFYLRTLWAVLFDVSSRPSVWWGLTFLGLIVLMISCATMGATSLARERENGTWDSLSLSLLSPGQIISGKFGAALFACGVFALPFLPLLVPCINWTTEPSTANAITPLLAGGSLLILLGTATSFTAWGMLWSWISKRTFTAVSRTLGTLFFIGIGIPALLENFDPRLVTGLIHPNHWSPIIAHLNFAESPAAGEVRHQIPLGFTVVMTSATVGILCLLRFLMQRDIQR